MTSNWVLALAYWLHLIATVLCRELTALGLLVIPVARRTLQPQNTAACWRRSKNARTSATHNYCA